MMNIRTIAVTLTLAAGSLFLAQPALRAQDYFDRDDRYQRHLDHERREMDEALRRGDYRAARREAREIEKLRRKAAREHYRRRRAYRDYEPYWNR